MPIDGVDEAAAETDASRLAAVEKAVMVVVEVDEVAEDSGTVPVTVLVVVGASEVTDDSETVAEIASAAEDEAEVVDVAAAAIPGSTFEVEVDVPDSETAEEADLVEDGEAGVTDSAAPAVSVSTLKVEEHILDWTTGLSVSTGGDSRRGTEPVSSTSFSAVSDCEDSGVGAKVFGGAPPADSTVFGRDCEVGNASLLTLSTALEEPRRGSASATELFMTAVSSAG